MAVRLHGVVQQEFKELLDGSGGRLAAVAAYRLGILSAALPGPLEAEGALHGPPDLQLCAGAGPRGRNRETFETFCRFWRVSGFWSPWRPDREAAETRNEPANARERRRRGTNREKAPNASSPSLLALYPAVLKDR